jgi:hypothetical protein
VAQTTVFYNGVRDLEFEIADKSGLVHTVVIKGSGAGLRGANAQPLPAVGAFGATVVDADLWSAVKAAYSEHPAFKGGFIKDGASDKEKAAAKEEVASLDNGQAPAEQGETGKRKSTKKK